MQAVPQKRWMWRMGAPSPLGMPRPAAPRMGHPSGLVSVLVAAGSLVLGAGYYLVLLAVPFPPDWVRVVPVVWLAGATAGLVLGCAACRASTQVPLAVLGLLLSLASLGLAAPFALGALMGD